MGLREPPRTHAPSVPSLNPRAANAGYAAPEGQERRSSGSSGGGGTRKTRAVPPLGPPSPRMRIEGLGGRSGEG